MENFRRRIMIFGIFVAFLVVFVKGSALAGPDSPFITATQASYVPGDTATILGYEFIPGQELVIKITRPDGSVVKADGKKKGSDTVIVDALGEFVYDYSLNSGLEGLFYVDAIDAATVVITGKDKSDGVVLASTVFEDHIGTDLELVGMPDAACIQNPRSGPRDGLVDAIAGLCLVGTVDVKAVGADNDIRGFTFDLVIDFQSMHQTPGTDLKDFIDQLETVSTAVAADPDTGSAPAPGGLFYTTAGNAVISQTGDTITSLDGTDFIIGNTSPGTMAGEVVFPVTVDSAQAGPIASGRFEYCARINANAGDSDNGRDGAITSTPETGGTETSPINVCPIGVDLSEPICEITFITDGVEVFISDPESGIASIEVLEIINATVSFNPSQPPPLTFDDITATALKVNLGQSSSLSLKITNGEGLMTFCDPVDFTLVRDDGSPVSHVFSLVENEGYLRIDNNGLQEINIDLNGSSLHFSVNGQGEEVYLMPENGVVSYDLTEYLLAGENTVEIKAVGKPNGGSARISISDLPAQN